MANDAGASDALGRALRIGVASASCLIIAECFGFAQTSLSVYTAYLVMAMFPISSFQKGLERFLGRVLGLLYGLLVIVLFRETPLIYLFLIALGQTFACYVNLSGRLAYAALMAAIFIGVMGALGITAPASAAPYAGAAAVQLALGELLAFLVNFVTRAERTLSIELRGQPLLPVRLEWLNTAAMLSAGQIATMFATLLLDVPVTATMISALIIGLVPGGLVEEGKKAWQRTLGAILGGGYALLCEALLELQPYLAILAALVFWIEFAATYLTITSKKNSYAYLQMGMVAPLVLLGEHGELGSVSKALQRVAGVAVGLTAAGIVSILWPHTPIAATPAPTVPAPQAASGSASS
jgi:uncharacterized membrane protein YgaE (UPF0421/DUF939 family)